MTRRSMIPSKWNCPLPAKMLQWLRMSERRFIWLRRSLLTSLCLLAAAWIFAEGSQWLFRRRAERLLTDLKSIEVGGNSADAQAILQKWHDRAEIETDCFGTERTTCHFGVYLRHQLPQVLRGDPEGGIRNRFQQIVGTLGLRSSNVGARVRTENGIVTRKWFAEEVDLPIRDWYLRGGAYVPTLTVDSDEELPSQHPAIRDQINIDASHPFRYARRYKGPWGLRVVFTTEESSSEKAALMDFHFSCITQFFPCRSERQVLEEGARLLDQGQ